MICPKCGKDTLRINFVHQYSYQHKVGKDGKILKGTKKIEIGPEDWAYLDCENCDLYLCDQERDSFHIEDNKIIIDKDFDEE